MLLVIDTSGSCTSVAIFSKSTELIGVLSEASESHSTRLELLIKQLLAQQSLKVEDISGLVLGAGPGSFTGLRISYAFAKGLALGLAVGIYEVSSLVAVGQQYESESSNILALADARRQQYFCASHDVESAIWQQDQILDLQSIEDWKVKYEDGLIVSADGLMLETKTPSKPLAVCVGESFFRAKNSTVLQLSTYQIAELKPNYVRGVSALSIKERQAQGLLK